MALLEAQKRDKLPDETLMAWFNTLRANSWTNEKLSKQVEVMLKNVTYGSIKIDDFFSSTEKYSAEEVELKISQRINSLIREGERLLQDQEINVELPPVQINIDSIRLAISKRLKVYYNEEVDESAKLLIDEIMYSVSERLGFKKVETVLSGKEKLRARLGR